MRIINLLMAVIITWVFGGAHQFTYAFSENNKMQERIHKMEIKYNKLSTPKKIKLLKRQAKRLNSLEKKFEKIPDEVFHLIPQKMAEVKDNKNKEDNVVQLKNAYDEGFEDGLKEFSEEEKVIMDKEFFNDNQKQAEAQAEKMLNKELILKNISIAKEKIKSEIENLQNTEEGRNPASGPYLLGGIGIILMIAGFVLVLVGIPLLIVGIGFIPLVVGVGAIAVGGALIGIEAIIENTP